MMNLVIFLALLQDPEREVLDRREEARGAFRATPQGIYGHYCAHCHSDDARGSGRLWATELSPKPADLVASKLDETALVKFVSEGSAASGKSNLCPPWGRTISESDIKRLARHLVSLRGGASLPVGEAPAPTTPVREPFPWALAGVLLAELILLIRMLRRRKEVPNVVSQDPPVR